MNNSAPVLRFGLCCLFSQENIHFKTHTAKHLSYLSAKERSLKLSATIFSNICSLGKAIHFCINNGIGSFRINSRILPLKTHPDLGYQLRDLPNITEILAKMDEVADLAKSHDIRLTFHPDQFTLLSSANPEVTRRSIDELLYHNEISELLGADVITLHGGGGYGDKKSALKRVAKNIALLPLSLKEKLALENDDRVYTPGHLLPLCCKMNIPFVYDVHHHRCLPDSLSEEEATQKALATWDREPLFHISSPREGWNAVTRRPHHGFIDLNDFPECWKQLHITVEVEAKEKEMAVLQLKQELLAQ